MSSLAGKGYMGGIMWNVAHHCLLWVILRE